MWEGHQKEFEKKWDRKLWEMKYKCRDILLEEYCTKLFYSMDNFWEEIADVGVDIDWLLKIRTHFDKIEKEQVK